MVPCACLRSPPVLVCCEPCRLKAAQAAAAFFRQLRSPAP